MNRTFLSCIAVFLTLAGCGSAPPPPPDAPPEVTVPPPSAAPTPAAEAKPEPPPAPTSEPSAAARVEPPPAEAKAAPEITGTIVSRKGTELTVDVAASPPPAAGVKGVLSRHFEQQLGPLSTSGWLVIADVVVKKASGGKVVLTIAEEKSTILVNGKKVDHFKGGTPIKIEIGP